MKDLYSVLGVEPTASQEEIKRAFQELAKRHHPDTALEKDPAGETFREIAAAYEVLGDPDRRREYDRRRPLHFGSDKDPATGGGSPDRKTRSWRFGGVPPHEGFDFPSSAPPPPQSATVRVPLRLAATGGEVHVTGLPGGTYILGVPAGTTPGSVATVQTPQGPFRIRLVLEDDPPFRLKGDDIETVMTLNLAEAVLGGKRSLTDPAGKELIVEIPECTPPGTVLRFPKRGLGGGDLLVRLELEFPRSLTPEARLLFARFAKKAGLHFQES